MPRKVYTSDGSDDERLWDATERSGMAGLLWFALKPLFDDWGRCTANPRKLKAAAFAANDLVTLDVISDALAVLSAHDVIRAYEADGRAYMYVPPDRWFGEQTHIDVDKRTDDRRDKPNGSSYPPPPDWDEWAAAESERQERRAAEARGGAGRQKEAKAPAAPEPQTALAIPATPETTGAGSRAIPRDSAPPRAIPRDSDQSCASPSPSPSPPPSLSLTPPPSPSPPPPGGAGGRGATAPDTSGGGGGPGGGADTFRDGAEASARPLAAVAEALQPEDLLTRYRAEYADAEQRIAHALATAKRTVHSQALYLRPMILRVLAGKEPPLVVAPAGPTVPPGPGRESASDINARLVARAAQLGAFTPQGVTPQ